MEFRPAGDPNAVTQPGVARHESTEGTEGASPARTPAAARSDRKAHAVNRPRTPRKTRSDATGPLVEGADRPAEALAKRTGTTDGSALASVLAGATDRETPIRIAMYSHDSYGLGHLRRSLRLAESIREAGIPAEMLLVSGSPRAHFYDVPEGLRVVSIPSVTKNSEGKYVSRQEGLSLNETVQRRKRQIRDEVLAFQPDLFIVDHSPTGLRGELLPLLADLRHRGRTEIALGMRDVLDEPSHVVDTWKRDGTYRLLEGLYDHLWVYGCREVFPIDQLYRIPETATKKMTYLGYLNRFRGGDEEPKVDVSASFPEPAKPHLVCLVGGGGDGYPLARTFLQTLALRPDRWNGTLVTGPFLSREKRNRLASRYGHLRNVQMIRFTSHIEDLVRSASLLVTMGGYNAVMEAMAFRKPAVVVPRVFPRKEQWLRATSFERLGLLRCLDPDDLHPESLSDAVRESLSEPLPPDLEGAGLRLDGCVNFANEVEKVRRRVSCSRKVNDDDRGASLRSASSAASQLRA